MLTIRTTAVPKGKEFSDLSLGEIFRTERYEYFIKTAGALTWAGSPEATRTMSVGAIRLTTGDFRPVNSFTGVTCFPVDAELVVKEKLG